MRNQTPAEKYINEVFANEDEQLKRIQAEIHSDGLSGINVSAGEGALLSFLIKSFKIKTIVEVGLLYGYSTLWMARALPEDGRIISLEKNEDHFKKATEMLKATEVGHKIETRCGDAVELLKDLKSEGPFDMTFIDANKGGYVGYLEWSEENVRPGGLIVGDNTFLFGGVYGESRDTNMGSKQVAIMREFNTRLADKSKFNSILIPTYEGLTVAQKL